MISDTETLQARSNNMSSGDKGEAYQVKVEPRQKDRDADEDSDHSHKSNDIHAGPAIGKDIDHDDEPDTTKDRKSRHHRGDDVDSQSDELSSSVSVSTSASDTGTFSGTIDMNGSAIGTQDFIKVTEDDRKTAKKSSFKHYLKISDEQVGIIQQSWKLVYNTNRLELIEKFQKSLMSDGSISENTLKLVGKGNVIPIVVDAHNRVIQFLSNDNDDDDEDCLHNNQTEEQRETAKESSFEFLYSFLHHIGKIHVLNNILTEDLLLSRKHLLKTLKDTLGAAYNDNTKQAFLNLTNFMSITLLIAFRESQGTVKYPSKHAVTYAMETWPFIEKNAETISIILWRELTDQFDAFTDYFPSPQSLKQIFSGIGRLVNLYKDKLALSEALHELGSNHIHYNVHSSYFKYFFNAWLKTLKQTLGASYKKKVDSAWKKILKYFIKKMSDSLDEEWMLKVPEEPSKLKVLIQIHHIDDINPSSYSFRSEVDISVSETKAPARMLQSKQSFEAYKAMAADTMRQVEREKQLKQEALQLEKQQFDMADAKPSKLGSRLGAKASNYDQKDWHLKIDNLISADKLLDLKHELQDGSHFQRMQIGGTFEKEFNMKNFPFDKHELMFHITCGAKTTEAAFDTGNLEIRPGKQGNLDRLGGSSWTVLDPCYQVIENEIADSGQISGQPETEEVCVITVPIVRKWKNYVWQVFFPLSVIELTAFAVYFMESDPIFYRMQFQAVLMSTLLAFKFTIMSMLPKVSYLTVLDYHFNLAFTFIFLHVCVAAVLRSLLNQYVSHSQSVETLWDMLSLISMVSIYAVAKAKMLFDTKSIIHGLEYEVDQTRGIRRLKVGLTGDGNKKLQAQPTFYSTTSKKIVEQMHEVESEDISNDDACDDGKRSSPKKSSKSSHKATKAEV